MKNNVAETAAELVPGWLPRRHRRRVERELRRVLPLEACSLCRRAFPHNSEFLVGFDAGWHVQNVGGCCRHRVIEALACGLHLDKKYDFLTEFRWQKPNGEPAPALDNEATYQSLRQLQDIIADADTYSAASGGKP
jgi:hypothetical protein